MTFMLARKRLEIRRAPDARMRRWNVPRRIGGALRWNPEMPVRLRRKRTRDAVAGPVTHIDGYRGALPLASPQPKYVERLMTHK